MKIEKINENQIRCFISNEDLVARKIKISELAYGTDKAKSLFREMMTYANKKYGFDSENLPLMIEAIPLSDNSLLLTITKVAFPDELDSRFSYFSDSELPESGLFGNIFEKRKSSYSIPTTNNANDIISVCAGDDSSKNNILRHFTFNSLDDVINAANVIGDSYNAENDLYKSKSGQYHLLLKIGQHSAKDFNKVCNCLSEYGIMESPNSSSYTVVLEHAKLICDHDALNKLSSL